MKKQDNFLIWVAVGLVGYYIYKNTYQKGSSLHGSLFGHEVDTDLVVDIVSPILGIKNPIAKTLFNRGAKSFLKNAVGENKKNVIEAEYTRL